METLNMLRGLLVAGAALAVVIALVLGQWAAALIVTAAIGAHVALWVQLHREKSAAQPGKAQTPPAANS